MFKKVVWRSLAAVMLLLAISLSGCSNNPSLLQRTAGLTPEGVVRVCYDAVKNNRLPEAALYVVAAQPADSKTLAGFMGGADSLDQVKNSNLLLVKEVARQGDYAVLAVTLQEQNTLKLTVKTVGLEKINNEWYLVDVNQIYHDAKYKLLLNLLSGL